jgi:arylsulfatase A-like enzyme
MGKLNRRDFLKLAALISVGATLPNSLLNLGKIKTSGTLPNVIVIVFDAMSARNLSVYGYPRKTTPNFERFAKRAFVYHSHYSAGNYTIPSTASLLTGMYPWTHRAINYAGRVASSLTKRNIFNLLGEEYNRYGFGQNAWADIFLNQFNADIDQHVPMRSFGAISPWISITSLRDANLGYQAFDLFLFSKNDPPGSLMFGLAERLYGFDKYQQMKSKDYPRGLPEVATAPFHFQLDSLFDGLQSLCAEFQPPYFSYLHLSPPHEPYRPTKAYYKYFIDDFVPPPKPAHRFIVTPDSEKRLNEGRLSYDRFIANLDAEFGRLLDTFETSGILDNSYVILTSDHGDMFERGLHGHSTPLLYDPVVHSPLLISVPGKQSRTDIYSPTNNVDIVPTLLSLAGREIPDWCEGNLLPGLGGKEDFERSTFSMDAKENSSFAPIKKATIAMRKGKYKMIYYTGYEEKDSFELYDMENDLEEMKDLYSASDPLSKSLAGELLDKLQTVNKKV